MLLNDNFDLLEHGIVKILLKNVFSRYGSRNGILPSPSL